MKKVSQIKAGSFLSYIQMALNVIIQLVYTPIMIRLLGQSEYGLYNTVASTIALLSILNLGFNSGYIRFYARYKKENDQKSINRLNGLFLEIFLIIGLIGFFCGIFLVHHLDIVFDKGLTSSEYETAHILMLLLSINLAISFPMSVFANIISAHEKFIYLKIVGMLKTVLSPILSIPLLLLGYGAIGIVAITVVVAFITDALYLYYVLGVMHEKFEIRGIEKQIFKDLFIFSSFIALNSLIDQINWNIDKILLGRFKGTAEVAIYSTGYTLYQCYMVFSTSISSVFTPRIHRIVNATADNTDQQRKQLSELFIKVGRIQFLILGLVSTGILFFGQFFITNIWVGTGYENSYYVALLLIFPASIALIQNLGIEIQRAQNKHKFRSIVYSGMALVNLLLSIYLCQLYGSIGSAVGTAISLVLANGIVMNIYYDRHCNIDVKAFWKNITSVLKGLMIPILFGVIIKRFITINNVYAFIALVFAYSLVYALSIWFLSINEDEKQLILSIFAKVKGIVLKR